MEGLPNSVESSTIPISKMPLEKVMRCLVLAGKHLDSETVYKALREQLPKEEVRKKIGWDYLSDTSTSMIKKVISELGEQYVSLLIDPAISTRVDDLIAFAHTQKEPLSPETLLEKFKSSLKTRRVYRVTALTEQELEDVKSNGFIANFYRNRSVDEILSNEDVHESIEGHMHGFTDRHRIHAGGFAQTKNSMLISTSDYPDMAQFAGLRGVENTWSNEERAGKKLYLIPIDIAESRNIRYGKYLDHPIQGNGIWRTKDHDIPYNDPGVESFVEFSIPANNIAIAEITVIDPAQVPEFTYIPPADGGR
jgi:hypothetical protein